MVYSLKKIKSTRLYTVSVGHLLARGDRKRVNGTNE